MGIKMSLSAFVSRRYLATCGRSRLWQLLRDVAIKLGGDPIYETYVHGRTLALPMSHMLPLYLACHQFYDRLPGRLGRFLRERRGYLHCIDVGANVGDTIAALHQPGDSFIAIEPNRNFLAGLRKNWGADSNVVIVPEVCSATSGEGTFSVTQHNGTGTVVRDNQGTSMRSRSLDDIIASLPIKRSPNLLKVDTDGHDFEVLKGARRFIESNTPTVLFECDHFGNPSYVADCMEVLNTFRQAGYGKFIVYDNFGHLMGLHSLLDLQPFGDLLFYQLTSNFYYYDILLLPEDDVDNFYESEVAFFRKATHSSAKGAALAGYQHSPVYKPT